MESQPKDWSIICPEPAYAPEWPAVRKSEIKKTAVVIFRIKALIFFIPINPALLRLFDK